MVLNPSTRKWLHNRFKDDVRFDEPMSRHTSLKVGGPAEAFVTPVSEEDLQALIQWAGEEKIPFLVIGDGTNLLVKDAGIAGIVIVLTKCLNQISTADRSNGAVRVRAMAGVRLHKLCTFAIAANLKGMNFAVGIPGTVGGAIMMNAGTSDGGSKAFWRKLRFYPRPAHFKHYQKGDGLFLPEICLEKRDCNSPNRSSDHHRRPFFPATFRRAAIATGS
jgi:UDP-N-acetylenolpyruvoylglucosamine reductase